VGAFLPRGEVFVAAAGTLAELALLNYVLDGGEGGGEAFAADRARFVVGGLVDAEAGNVAYYLVGYWFANGR
jgi:hypothetical protein